MILADTAAGRALIQATRGQPWAQAQARWLELSREFARTASGEVNVFHGSEGVRLASIWRTEYGVLTQNPRVSGIVYRVVMPEGTVVVVP